MPPASRNRSASTRNAVKVEEIKVEELAQVNSDDDEEDEDGDEDDEDDEDEEESEEEIVPRVLPQRANRGNRMAELMKKAEQEETSEFWQANKEAFEEGETDSDFSAGDTSDDQVDADFDAPENDDEEVKELLEAELAEKALLDEERKRRRNAYHDPALKRKQTKIARGGDDMTEETPVVKRPRIVKVKEVNEERLNRPRRRAVLLAQEARDVENTGKQRKVAKERAKSQYKVLTQEEQLIAARDTEIWNKESLQQLLHIEELQKVVVTRKPVHKGSTVRYVSSLEETVDPTASTNKRKAASKVVKVESSVEFNMCAPFEYVHHSDRPVLLRKKFDVLPCVITRLPAKYRDPVTGLPFATIDALRQIRNLHLNNQLDLPALKAQLYSEVRVTDEIPQIQNTMPQNDFSGLQSLEKKRGRKKLVS